MIATDEAVSSATCTSGARESSSGLVLCSLTWAYTTDKQSNDYMIGFGYTRLTLVFTTSLKHILSVTVTDHVATSSPGPQHGSRGRSQTQWGG